MKKVLIFGAGSIGKGLIGYQLSQEGYRLIYVDARDRVIQQIRVRGGYEVELAGTNQRFFVPVSDILPLSDHENIGRYVRNISLIITAVGPQDLTDIARIIAPAVSDRIEQAVPPLHIIACENMINASSYLSSQVETQGLSNPKKISAGVSFPNCVVDRISITQTDVTLVEDYYEWIVENSAWVGNERPTSMQFVEHLEPYLLLRKLYVLNGAHITIGCIGTRIGVTYAHEVLQNQEIYNMVTGQMHEAICGLICEYHLDQEEQQQYVMQTLKRLQNPALKDPISRLTRGKIRKMRREERLVGPALLAIKHGIEPTNIARGVVSLLKHQNPDDSESIMIQTLMRNVGLAETIIQLANLNPANAVDAHFLNLVEQLYSQEY